MMLMIMMMLIMILIMIMVSGDHGGHDDDDNDEDNLIASLTVNAITFLTSSKPTIGSRSFRRHHQKRQKV